MNTQHAMDRKHAHIPRRSTLLNLLAIVNQHTNSDAEAAEAIVHLVNTGRVELTGNFRGHRFHDAA